MPTLPGNFVTFACCCCCLRYTLPEPDALWNAVWAPAVAGPGGSRPGPGSGSGSGELNLSSVSLQLPTSAIIEAYWPRGEDGARVCGAQACPLVYEAFEYEALSRPKSLAQCKERGKGDVYV